MNFIEDIIESEDTKELRFRFPPEPNGLGLHIGHAKAMCVNFGLAEKYGAPCNLRMDDTNPLVESEDNVKAIVRDVEWLGFDWDGDVRRTSEYLPKMMRWLLELVESGKAYMDMSTSEEIAEMKGTPTEPGINSPYRDNSVDENVRLSNTRKGVMRAKVDMAHDNMLMRDPIIYRYIPEHGWYPMYDFAHPLSDYIEGITHSLCTLEFEPHRAFYEWVLDALNLKGTKPRQIEFSRLNLSHSIMSKRHLNRLIEEGVVGGWDDPRLPTISGMRARGFTPTSIKEFCERVGVTKFNGVSDFALLESILREELNVVANRAMVVLDPLKLEILNMGDITSVEVENNPEDPTAGTRVIPISNELWIERDDFRIEASRKYHRLKMKPGHYVRLKGGIVLECFGYEASKEFEVKTVFCKIVENPDKVKATIHWVDAATAIPVVVDEYAPLFNSREPGKDSGDFMEDINPESLVVRNGYAEPSVVNVAAGDRLQFLRNGYYVRNEDGSFNKTVGLRSSFKD